MAGKRLLPGYMPEGVRVYVVVMHPYRVAAWWVQNRHYRRVQCLPGAPEGNGFFDRVGGADGAFVLGSEIQPGLAMLLSPHLRAGGSHLQGSMGAGLHVGL